MARIGIMGGTFDPLHIAHLVMAETARATFGLDRVIFVPAGSPPHKVGQPVSDPEHRYAMTVLGTATNPLFEVSRVELEREGPSYSVDTIRELKAGFGPEAEIFFIVGSDEALDLGSWHEAESLPALARFLVVPRPGISTDDCRRQLPKGFAGRIDLLPTPSMDISATDLRRRVAEGASIRYLVPESVESYIRKHGLYLPDKRAARESLAFRP